MSESAESLNAKMGESSGIILGLGISYHILDLRKIMNKL